MEFLKSKKTHFIRLFHNSSEIHNWLRGWNDVQTWWIENLWTEEGFAMHLGLKHLFERLRPKKKQAA